MDYSTKEWNDLETLIDIAVITGAAGYSPSNSRDLPPLIMEWATEFNALHINTQWDINADYLLTVDTYTYAKIEIAKNEDL